LYTDEGKDDLCLDIVQALCEIMERKQPRMVKYAKPALKHAEKTMGKDRLKDTAVKAFLRASSEQAAAATEVDL
jgi:hypothetical protein